MYYLHVYVQAAHAAELTDDVPAVFVYVISQFSGLHWVWVVITIITLSL